MYPNKLGEYIISPRKKKYIKMVTVLMPFKRKSTAVISSTVLRENLFNKKKKKRVSHTVQLIDFVAKTYKRNNHPFC